MDVTSATPARERSRKPAQPSAEPAVPEADAVLARPGIAVQRKLAVGASDDPLEVEADLVASSVVDALRAQSAQAPEIDPGEPDAAGSRLDAMRRAVLRHPNHTPGEASIGPDGGELPNDAEDRLRRATSGGAPLPTETRGQMESALGAELGDVRMHVGPEADALNTDIAARAFTVDNHIFFRDGMPDTSSPAGQHLLAHELTHVVQQQPGAHRSTIRRDGDDKKKGSGGGTGVLYMDEEGVGHEALETESDESGGGTGVLHTDDQGVGHEAAETESEESGGGTGVLHMDDQGVGHKEPDKSKAPGVLFMDQQGVGHKEPDKSKAPGVLFMDQQGVGHKGPDKVPSVGPIALDDKGVGYAKAEDPQVQSAQRVYRNNRDDVMPRLQKMKDTGAKWDAFKTTAQKQEQDAVAAFTNASNVWDVEKADSGITAAREADKAKTAGTAATKAKNDAHALEGEYLAASGEFAKKRKNLDAGVARFSKDKPTWLKTASPATKIAIDEIQAMFDQQLQARKEADAVESVRVATLAEIDRAAAAAAKAATDAAAPLGKHDTLYVIIGLLQQKLNAANSANGGARISVTSEFDDDTVTALQKFQTDNGLGVTGIADVATWTELDKVAPAVTRNGDLRVEDEDKAKTVKPDAGIHPKLSFPTTGAAVRELQERLNNWQGTVAGKKPFAVMSVDGIFGIKTRSAVQAFQRAHGLKGSAVVDDATWAELDKQGAVSKGVRQLSFTQTVEGSLSGSEARYDWEVTKDNRLVITVKLNFTGSSKHPKVKAWLQDIKDVWNGFKAVEDGGARSYDIEFNPVVSSSGHKVRVGEATKKNPNPRSDAGNWYVTDNRKGLAPHEFGHLIGLADEYNRPEEQYVETTGQEPKIGSLGLAAGSSIPDMVTALYDAIDTNKDKSGEEIGTALADAVTAGGVTQGSVARIVAKEYQKAHPFEPEFGQIAATHRMPADFTTYLWYKCKWKRSTGLTVATQAFSESNTSIMGTMESVPDGADANAMAAIPPHDHPVQPRHLRSFTDLLIVAMPGSKWKTQMR